MERREVLILSVIVLSNESKYKKFQLASVLGYKLEETGVKDRCKVLNIPDCFDNDFRNIDEFLILVSDELRRKGFVIAA